MKTLVIPSWYPYPAMPHAGSFFLEQAKALAKQPDCEVSILNWGQNEFQMQLRKPMVSLLKLINFYKAQNRTQLLEPGLTELVIPHLSWTSRIAKANIAALVAKINLTPLPDIIHAHVSFPAGYLAMQLSRRYGIPYLITEHSGPFPFPEYISQGGVSPLITEPITNAAEIIAVSTSLASSIHEHIKVQAMIIPNMVNTDFFVPKPGCKSEDSLRLFCMSQMTVAKGAWDLLEAVRLLKNNGLDFCLYWAGDGILKKALQLKANEYALGKHLVFTGQLSRKQALLQYQLSDCLVMPSHIESFSIVLIEAMACGKPVVATDCGGPKDIVNTNNGWLIPPKDPNALCEAVLNMKDRLHDYQAEQIRNYCVANYSPSVVCQKIVSTYNKILNK